MTHKVDLSNGDKIYTDKGVSGYTHHSLHELVTDNDAMYIDVHGTSATITYNGTNVTDKKLFNVFIYELSEEKYIRSVVMKGGAESKGMSHFEMYGFKDGVYELMGTETLLDNQESTITASTGITTKYVMVKTYGTPSSYNDANYHYLKVFSSGVPSRVPSRCTALGSVKPVRR